MTKIYVGNLPFSAEESTIRELFEKHGDVTSIAMISDRETGRFRGFCFVEMESDGAAKAIAALDGEDFDGRPLRVNEARPREERGGGRGGRGGGGGGGYGGGGGGGYGGGGGGGYGGGGGGGRDRNRNRDRDRY